MVKEKDHDFTTRREFEGALRKVWAQDGRRNQRRSPQAGAGERPDDRLPQRRSGAGHSPGFHPRFAHSCRATQPPGRVYGAQPPRKVAGLVVALVFLVGCGGQRRTQVKNLPPAPPPVATAPTAPTPTLTPSPQPAPSRGSLSPAPPPPLTNPNPDIPFPPNTQ